MATCFSANVFLDVDLEISIDTHINQPPTCKVQSISISQTLIADTP